MKPLLLMLLLLIPGLCGAVEGCNIDVGSGQWQFVPLSTPTVAEPIVVSIDIECQAGLDFQVEVASAEAGGVIELEGPGGVLPVRMLQGTTGNMPWGKASNGEGMGGTGTGQPETMPVRAQLNIQRVPPSGEYSGQLDMIIFF